MTSSRPRPTTRPALTAARRARGWSQTDAARELAALARTSGGPGATAASLKSLLSRWENGHATPEPQYRALLSQLYERSPTELGLAPPAATAAPGAADRLRARLAMAAAIEARLLRTWADQLEVARRLDDEVGAAGSAGLVSALVDELDQTLTHTVHRSARGAVAALLAEACVLAGWQDLDQGDPEQAWLRFAHARTHVTQAGTTRPAESTAAQAGHTRPHESTAAQASAGQAAVLIDLGDPAAALALLTCAGPTPSDQAPTAPAQPWIAAAQGAALAAAGRLRDARLGFDAAERALSIRADTSDGPAGVTLELAAERATLRCWRGQALAHLDDRGATATLEQLLQDGVHSVRNRAAAHATLATTLAAGGHTPAAGQHARTARALAERIGSARTLALLNPTPPAP